MKKLKMWWRSLFTAPIPKENKVASVAGSLLLAVAQAASHNKPAILAALVKHNVQVETFVAEAIKSSVKNPVLGLILSELVPELVKALPNLEDAAFNSLLALVEAEAAKL
jgi:hypothetical protein